jgi:methyl-accepting chemotaxis protein
MDGTTQQNAALVEQAAAAAQSMQDQAATLAEIIDVFKVDSATLLPIAGAARRLRVLPGVA